MRVWIQRVSIVMASLVGISSLAAWWAVQQTQYVPEFYALATQEGSKPDLAASRKLQADVERLQSDASRIGTWLAAFTDDEINAWLSEELSRKFPRLDAWGASEPRIRIEDDRVLVAVRYQRGKIDTVVSCELQVELTEEPNMLAFRVQNLRAGALPLPLSKFLQGITKEAARGDIDVHWDMTQAGPIALVNVPSDEPRYALSPVVVESVLLIDGALMVSGHTGKLSRQTYRPQGPVYQFVSYQPGDNRNDHGPRWSARSESGWTTIR